MSINIKKVVIHNLIKEQNSLSVELDDSSETYELNDKMIELIEKLNKSYNSHTILYGSFEVPTGVNFVSTFDTYTKDPSNDEKFIEFSKASLNILKNQINKIGFAKGGFFIYTFYEYQGKDYTAVYIIRDKDGILFNKRDGVYEIDDVSYIDTENLAMGCRISMKKYLEGEVKHLSFTRGKKQQAVSDYFINWISAEEAMSNREFTNQLYKLMNSMDRPKSKDGEQISIDEFRERVHSYIKSQPNELINLHDLGTHFYQDEGKFVDRANELELDLSTEFRADKKELSRFTKVEVVSDDMVFKFARSFYNKKKVRVDEDNPDLVIIESGRFARALKRKVDEHSNG